MRVRRARLRLWSLAALVLATGALSESAGPIHAQAARPNIVFILTDDLDLGMLRVMPHLNELMVRQGVSFSNYFASVSECCPSRATTLRGQYAHNTGVLTNGSVNGGFQTAYSLGIEGSTIATWLREGGYRTALFGKYLNEYPATAGQTYVPPGWTEWNSAVVNAYGQNNYTLNENGRLVAYGATPAEYATDVFVNKAVAFMSQSAADGAPFFVYLSVYAPHPPAQPARRHRDMFFGVREPRTPSYNESDVSDKPSFIQNRPRFLPMSELSMDTLYRKRLQSMQAVDEGIAAIIASLEASGQLQNTYIVFTSDNGFHMGQHRLTTGKLTAYEEDIHLPLIVRGPGVPAGTTVDNLSGNADLAPTFADMAGIGTAPFVDGRSMLPLLHADPPAAATWRQAYLLEHWKKTGSSTPDLNGEPADLDGLAGDATVSTDDTVSSALAISPTGTKSRVMPEFRGLRTDRYTYVEYATGEKELYDLAADPYELTNIAATADPALLSSFASRLAELNVCAGAACRAAEDKPLVAVQPSSSGAPRLLLVPKEP